MAEQKPKKSKATILKLVFRGILAALLLGALANFYSVYSFYSTIGKQAFDAGRKIIIDVKSGEVKLTENKDVQDLKANENADSIKDSIVADAKEAAAEKPEDASAEAERAPAESSKDLSAPEVLNYKTANLAIIITDVGLRQNYMDSAKNLPKEVTFSFSPYSRDLQNKIRVAKNEGREIMLQLAFESENYPLTDTGQFTMQSFFEANQNIFRLQAALSSADGFTGVMAPLDEVLTDKREVMTPILENLKKKKLYFSYLRNAKNTALENDAKPMAVSILPVDYALTEKLSQAEIKDVLSNIKIDLLKRKKRVVLAIKPYPVLITTVQEWLKSNVGANIQVAPASYFVIKN